MQDIQILDFLTGAVEIWHFLSHCLVFTLKVIFVSVVGDTSLCKKYMSGFAYFLHDPFTTNKDNHKATLY